MKSDVNWFLRRMVPSFCHQQRSRFDSAPFAIFDSLILVGLQLRGEHLLASLSHVVELDLSCENIRLQIRNSKYM